MALAPRNPTVGRDVEVRRRLKSSRPTPYQLQETSVADIRHVGRKVDELQTSVARLEGRVVSSGGNTTVGFDQLMAVILTLKQELLNAMDVLKQQLGDKIAEQNTRIKGLAVLIDGIVAKANEEGMTIDEMKAFLASLAGNDAALADIEAKLAANT